MGTVDNNIIDIDLSQLRKKKIRIDGDDNKIIEINTSDMGVMERLKNSYDKLLTLANKYHEEEELEISDLEKDRENVDKLINSLSEIDTEMRKLVDYVFNAPVSEVCTEDGTMADPFNGQFRFEYIIDKFIALYDENFTKEFKKLSTNVQKHTNKYTRK